MTPTREIELKLEVSQQDLAHLARSPLLRKARARMKRATLVSVYYDTDTLKLRKHGLILRIRRIGRRYVQTIKGDSRGNSTLMNRSESEHVVVGSKLNFDIIGQAGFEAIATRKVQAKLKPLFETRVRRKLYPIRVGNNEVELTVDQGTVVAGRRSSPICEVELELKRGDPAELFNFARALAEQIPVQLAVTSKSDRGYALITGEKPRATRATTIAIAPDASCQTAFQIIARACLRQIIANQTLACHGDSEGVHQARVGLRRLRAAISLFAGILLDPQSEGIKTELKWITRELGPARELNVFIEHVVMPAAASKPQQPGVTTLTRELRARRREALSRVRSAIESERFRMLVLDTAAWIESGDWTHNGDDLSRAIRSQPIGTAAAAEMERRYKKIVRLGAKLTELEPARRHRVRIQAKKLRYACEFFRGAFPGKKAVRRRDELVGALERLQAKLGDLNDISVHEGLAERLAGSQHVSQNSRTASKAFAAGRLSGREEARVAPVLKDAKRAYAKFRQTKPFWR